MEERHNLICGLWKFKETVDPDLMEEVAEEFAKDPHYVHVYIRKVSKDQYGIGVSYVSDRQVTSEVHDKFMEEQKDMLYKRFGVGLVGWDFANTTKVFKGF